MKKNPITYRNVPMKATEAVQQTTQVASHIAIASQSLRFRPKRALMVMRGGEGWSTKRRTIRTKL
jgi:hypothetical protein